MLRHASTAAAAAAATAATATAPTALGDMARTNAAPFAERRAAFVAELAKLDIDQLEAQAVDEQPIVLKPWREIFAEEVADGMSVEDARFQMDCYS